MEPTPNSSEPNEPQTSSTPLSDAPVDETASPPEVSATPTESSLEAPSTEPITPLLNTPSTSEPSAAATSEAEPAVSSWSATPASATATSEVTPLAMPTDTKSKKPAKLVALIAAVVVLVGAGSAAAYFGVVVPNKPENVLQTALVNTLGQQQINYKGSIDLDSSGTAMKATFSGAGDSTAKAADVQLAFTVSGVNVSLEGRVVDKNVYVKAGDLSSLAALAGTFAPDYAAPATAISKALSDKWIVIDSTLLKEAGVSCVLDSNWSLTKADLTQIQDQYKKHPFTTIVSNSGDTVDGKKVQKFELSLDDNKLASFGNNLNNLSVTKSLADCQKGKSLPKASDAKGDGDKTPVTVWVDKSTKRIVKIASTSTAQDLKKSNLKGSGSITFSYEKVSIKAPEGATPLLQVIATLQTALGGTGLDLTQLIGTGGASSSSNANDTKRKTDIASLQTQLEAYFAEKGNYPSFAQFNSASWRKTNMKSLDETALQDPDSSSTTLATQPAAHSYSYAPTGDTGASCEADATSCSKYELTATLSDGTKYSKTSLN